MIPDDLDHHLKAWMADAEPLAGERVRNHLARVMAPTPRLLRVLSADELDEIRQDVLAHLMDRDNEQLVLATHPLAYARRCWANACTSALRKWGPRQECVEEVRRFLDTPTPGPDQLSTVSIDADIAIAAMEVLTPRQRVALLLITRPAAIAPADWSRALPAQRLGLPAVPLDPIEREEAARLLFGDASSAGDRRRRQTSFDKLVRRAIAALQSALGIEK